MRYFEEVYGKRTKDFIDGVIAGVEAHAIWKNGIQYVGIRKIPLDEYIEDIKDQMGYPGDKP